MAEDSRVPNDPSTPSSDGACHFLRLPAELRNAVYSYALSDPAHLVCREDAHDGPGLFRFYPPAVTDKKLPPVGRNDINLALVTKEVIGGPVTLQEVNQLKYVCRQLKNETKTIIVGTDLLFERGAYQFTKFLDVLPTPLFNHLESVTILENRHSNGSVSFLHSKPWQTIVDLCRRNPTFTVRMRLPWLNANFLLNSHPALKIAFFIRLDSDFVQKVASLTSPTILNNLGWTRNCAFVDFPINIRISPLDEEFDEEAFRVMHRQWIHRTQLARIGVEAWVDWYKDIYNNGI
ncbi:uncharacterized protein K460DRAFT_415119 [Cucurbitaria berberidis CBS 394.84]|uniref:Uncharacterized protein n=1 Tax=Cucurbitaria berberidis CBS 394.84 TaxID=1168544 RepID=A0A9P4GNB8_9PLEO|nr:uncharacterized protein K460DRAFT_415119 [Cucurbitaria berberidis CBS 394.84]KAF1848579.1 hypothetical protein K460DRAFT_415119 [Cucurbitaria berberidis CBS 394.84]